MPVRRLVDDTARVSDAAQFFDDPGSVVEHHHVAIPLKKLGGILDPEGGGIHLAELGVSMHLAAVIFGNVLHRVADRTGGIDMAMDPIVTQLCFEPGLAIHKGHLGRGILVGDLMILYVEVVALVAFAIKAHHASPRYLHLERVWSCEHMHLAAGKVIRAR